jgi:hypothetical protein
MAPGDWRSSSRSQRAFLDQAGISGPCRGPLDAPSADAALFMPWLKNGEGSETTYTRFETDRKKALLFEKSKNFGPFAYALRQRLRLINKSSLLLFLEKELLPLFRLLHLWRRSGFGQFQGKLVLD